MMHSKKTSNGFFACYLLTSLNPRFQGRTYIGFTVNPRRRIRQHNGEIGSGAWRTKTKRPWEMVLCIYGFATDVSALQFEWAWQHPKRSLAVRQAALAFKSLSGIPSKIKLAYTMLNLPAWKSMKITVNYFSTKYTKHSACCPSLPEQMKVQLCSMDELPRYCETEESLSDNGGDLVDREEFLEEMPRDSSVGRTSSVKLVSTEECESRPLSRFTSGEESRQQSELVDLPFQMSSSTASSSHMADTTSSLDTLLHTASSTELNLSRGVTSTTSTTTEAVDVDKYSSDSPNMCYEVEIIDVSTPSSECSISSSNKRRKRASEVCRDIIDLTESPIIVQL